MSELELLLREIEDKWTRENFFRLVKFVKEQVILSTDWKLHEIRFDGAVTNFKYPHRQGFIPYDVIVLQVIGDRNVEFNYDKFDLTNLDITVKGACYVRFLAGRLKDRVLSEAARQGLTNVSVGTPGGSPTPLPNISRVMNCSSGAAVNDWVYHSKVADDTVVVHTNNTIDVPTLGIITDKPTSTTADVLMLGLYSGLTISTRGVIRLGTTGTATGAVVTTGYIQNLGQSFGNNVIFVNPDKHRLLRTP